MNNLDRNKFRVWDKLRLTFLPQNSCYIRQDGGMSFYQSFRDQKGNYDYAGEFDENRYVKQRSTELRDKNGKLIYEGDIVNAFCKIANTNYTGEVVFGNGCFWIKDVCVFSHLSDFEIISNVYDNAKVVE